MPQLRNLEMYCEKCTNSTALPVCCGKTMEYDQKVFFCSICNKEREVPLCCETRQNVRIVIKKIKEELFSNPDT